MLFLLLEQFKHGHVFLDKSLVSTAEAAQGHQSLTFEVGVFEDVEEKNPVVSDDFSYPCCCFNHFILNY